MREGVYKQESSFILSNQLVVIFNRRSLVHYVVIFNIKYLSAARIIGCVVKVIARFPERVKGGQRGQKSSKEPRHQWQGSSKL